VNATLSGWVIALGALVLVAGGLVVYGAAMFGAGIWLAQTQPWWVVLGALTLVLVYNGVLVWWLARYARSERSAERTASPGPLLHPE
jgi:hypothetical protein